MSVVNTTANPRKQASLVAGIGALIGVLAFLLLPYLIFTVTITETQFSPPQPHSASITVGTSFISIFAGLIWVELLLSIAILVIAAMVAKDASVAASSAPVETQNRRWSYAMIGLGAAGIAYHFLFISTLGAAQMFSLFQSLTTDTNNVAALLSQSHTTATPSMENAFGSWIYLVGMVVAIIGGVLMLRTVSPQAAAQPQSWPQYAQFSQPSQTPQSQPQAWQQPTPPQQQGWQQPPYPQQQR